MADIDKTITDRHTTSDDKLTLHRNKHANTVFVREFEPSSSDKKKAVKLSTSGASWLTANTLAATALVFYMLQ